MRTLNANKQEIYYSLLVGSEEKTDTSGNYTGTREKTYSTPESMLINVSPARGDADDAIFGVDLKYTKTMVTNDISCPIDEHSCLWIGKTPTEGEHNYVVVRVAKSLNSIMYAVDEVKLS